MYSPSVIGKVLDDFEMREGWRPEYHSPGEVEEFKSYIESITTIEQTERNQYIDFKPGLRLTQNKINQVKRWLKNEKFLCFADASYFMTRYAYICNEAGDIMKFQLRLSQEIFLHILEEFDDQQIAIELFILKARQLGISTLVVVLFLHRLLFVSHTQGVMASVKAAQSELLARIFDTCWSRLPFWLTPEKVVTKISAPQWANGSIMSIQSGSQAVGIAQGWTPTLIHISELADIPNPKKVLEEGLFRAAHSTRKLFFVLEGTGSDPTSWQSEKWKYYKENWGKGGRFCPLFIPWPCAADLYPQSDWLRKSPIPEMWTPLEETKRMKHKAELYIRSAPQLSRVMGANWTMPREQMWYWEANYREHLASHTTKVWLAQMPVSDLEAMQGKHDLVFSDDTIIEVNTKRKKDYQAYAVTGDSVMIGQNDDAYEPDPELIDYDAERIRVSWKCKDGHSVRWELIPLKEFDDTRDEEAFNKLLVFHPPKEGADYSIGVDTADGLGMPDEDRTVVSCILNRQGNLRDEQVCEFVSTNVNPAQAVSICACVAAWYGQWEGGRAHTKDPRGVKFCIEQRDRPGDDCQHQLKLMGFFWHHRFDRIDKIHSGKKDQGTQLGFMTNQWSRPWLLNKFVDAVIGNWLKINSPMCTRQMQSWVRKIEASGKSKMDHDTGKHDDCIFGAALGYLTRHSHDVLIARQSSKNNNDDDSRPPLNEGWCEGHAITV